jgi:hypothetical protein
MFGMIASLQAMAAMLARWKATAQAAGVMRPLSFTKKKRRRPKSAPLASPDAKTWLA